MTQPRVPLGQAIRRNDAERARAAQITARDIAEARLLFNDLAPDPFKRLLEATVDPAKAKGE